MDGVHGYATYFHDFHDFHDGGIDGDGDDDDDDPNRLLFPHDLDVPCPKIR